MEIAAIILRKIPVQAEIISRIIRLDAESNSCFHELDNYVHSDQGIAALVLRVANSALYCRGRKISTIPLAISVLGFNVVRSLAVLAFSRSLFAQSHEPSFRRHVWQHSLLTAIAGRELCLSLGGADEDEAFVAGLMHDMGKVLLYSYDPVRYLKVIAAVVDDGERSLAVEQRVFGVDHCAVGREAVVYWKLPERFVDYMGADLSARTVAESDPVRLALVAANCVVAAAGIGAKRMDEDAAMAALQGLGLDAVQSHQCIAADFIDHLMEDETYRLCASL